jgi:hypothetical protein
VINETDFARLLDNVARLDVNQHNQLLNQLHHVYKQNYIGLNGDAYKALAWRVKQAWQIVNFHVNPPKK